MFFEDSALFINARFPVILVNLLVWKADDRKSAMVCRSAVAFNGIFQIIKYVEQNACCRDLKTVVYVSF